MPNLQGSRIKLARAAQHIAELSKLARSYLDAKPFSLRKIDEPNGDLVWRVSINRQVPLEWSAILGDAVHNMRSALDLLAWQLVEENSCQLSRNTCFPIASAAGAQFEKHLQLALLGSSDSAIKFVRRLRPYSGGNQTLVQLHALDVVDKHRLVLVVGAANKQVIIKMQMKVPWADKPIEFSPVGLNLADCQFPLENDDEVFRVRAVARSSDQPEHEIVFELAFGDTEEVRGHALISTLQLMHKHVSRICDIAESRLLT